MQIIDTIVSCREPAELISLVGDKSIGPGYDDVISVEGTTIMFSCPPGLLLIGSSSATCTENGEWEPDPSGVTCNG